MAARSFKNQSYQLEPEVVTLFGRFTGAGDAANPTALKGKGITSVTSAATGVHILTLANKYNGLLYFTAAIIDTTTLDDWEVTLATDLVTNNTVTFHTFKGGTLANLTTDEKLLFKLDLSNSAALPLGY